MYITYDVEYRFTFINIPLHLFVRIHPNSIFGGIRPNTLPPVLYYSHHADLRMSDLRYRYGATIFH